MSTLAREALRVGSFGEAQPGMVFFALRHEHNKSVPAIFPADAWEFDVRMKSRSTSRETWEVIRWTVTVSRWPAQPLFEAAITASLHALLDAHAVVAWVGLPTSFAAPPALFVAEYMHGPVLVAATPDSPNPGVLELDAPLSPLTDDACSGLRQASQGLARAHPPGWVRLG